MKTCSVCHSYLSESEFHKRSDRPCGTVSKCKTCAAKIDKKKNSSSEAKTKRRTRYLENVSRVAEQTKKYREAHREEKSARDRIWMNSDPRRHKAHSAANYFYRNDERVLKCADCRTTENVEKAHHDYSKPLEVIPLCCHHHRLFDSDQAYRAKMLGFIVRPTALPVI